MIGQRISLMMFIVLLGYHNRVTNGQTFSFSQPATGPGSVCEGSDVTLQCVVALSFNNITTVQSTVWSRNIGGIVTTISTQPPIPNHRVVFNSTTGVFTDLLITNITLEDDNTVYSCGASGATITSSVVLNVTGPPSPINDFNIREICSTTISGVSWTPSSGDPVCGPVSHELTISPTDQMIMIIRITDTSYDITGLTPDTSYNLTVISSNMAGSVESVMTISTPSRPSGVNLTNTTTSEDTITVTWDAANSPYCGGILYYIVMISSDEHSNIMNAIMIVTDLSSLTATFSDLMNDTNYTIAVTPYNRVVAGITTTLNIRTSSAVPTQSNTSTNPSNSPTNPSNSPSTCVSESDDELSTGVVVAISIVVTFIITLVVTALISIIITSLYYKHLFKKLLVRQEGDSHALTEDIKSNDPAHATTRANITMDTNPAYGTATAIKMDTNPAYATTST